MCDPMDDTVDVFQSLQAGIATQLSLQNYDTEDFRLFHESLLYVCEYEDRIFKSLTAEDKWSLEKRMMATLDQVENDLETSN